MALVFDFRSGKHAFPIVPLSLPTNFSRGSVSMYRVVNIIQAVYTLTLWPVDWKVRPLGPHPCRHRVCLENQGFPNGLGF